MSERAVPFPVPKDTAGLPAAAPEFVDNIVDLHRVSAANHESGAMLRQMLEALLAAIYTTDEKGRITYFNRAAAELAGREPVLGRDEWCVTWRLYLPDGTPLPHDQCPMAVALRENRAVRGVEAILERPDGTRRPFLPFPTPLRDLTGKLVGAVNMLVDISERKDSEARQKLLLAELNHRVKNNMQVLHALLRGAQRETENPEAKAVLEEAGQRVGAMAAAQQVLYDAPNSEKFEAATFMDALCRVARQTFGRNVAIRMDCAPAMLPNDAAIPLALMLNELVTNAVRHARAHGSAVSIAISLQRDGAGWRLEVADDGPGSVADEAQHRASGLGLVRGLAAQLGGALSVDNDQGARCVVRFCTDQRS